MYDALLQDFNNDTTRTRLSTQTFSETVTANAADAPTNPLREGEVADTNSNNDELSAGVDETESWSDDPVRMYLTQMGEIPLLTRREEITLAKRIEDTRRQFRTRLLESDYVIKAAYKTLVRVYRGELPFDRTVQVSVTDRLEKEQILGRIGHNLKTLSILLKQNRHDFLTAYSKTASAKKRQEAWACLLYTSPSPRDKRQSRMPSSA